MELHIGTKLYGFCGGLFGRDHYGPCRIEAMGADWVVVRNEDGSVDFASDDTRDDPPRSWRDSLSERDLEPESDPYG